MSPESAIGHTATGTGAPAVTDAGGADVWYAAYGSNLERSRLALYLHGGTHPLTGRVTPGCRERRDPVADCAHELPFSIVFARHSQGWDGAIAFLDDRRPGQALARLWRLSAGQLTDIISQENGRPPGSVDAGAIAAVGPDRREVTVIPGGWYGKVRWCGEHEGLPIVTCTTDTDLAAEHPAPPSASYLATVARGLRECGHDDDAISTYLLALPGVAGAWDGPGIAELLR